MGRTEKEQDKKSLCSLVNLALALRGNQLKELCTNAQTSRLEAHISEVIGTVAKALAVLRWRKSICFQHFLLIIYKSPIVLHLDYLPCYVESAKNLRRTGQHAQ